MALIGNMINQAFSGNPATVNYAMFTSAFSMFTLFYLVPASFNTDWSGHPIILIVLDTLNAIFFLTSGIALAARLECHDCSNDVRFPPHKFTNENVILILQKYTLNNEVTNGAEGRTKRCREAQASVAFLWFAWAGYTASMILSFIQWRQSGGSRQRPRTGPSRPSRPSMAQV